MAEHAGRDWVFSLFDIVILGRDARAAVRRGDGAFWLRAGCSTSTTLDQSSARNSCRYEEACAGSWRELGVWQGGTISADSNRVIRRDPRLEGRVVGFGFGWI